MPVRRNALAPRVVAALLIGAVPRVAPAQPVPVLPPVEAPLAPPIPIAITPDLLAEPAPLPRPADPDIRLAAAPNGYEIVLSRAAAVALRDALDESVDEQQLAKNLRERARTLRDGAQADSTAKADADAKAAKIELLAFAAANTLPGFKKDLHDKMGADGVVIRAAGFQKAVAFRRPRPRLERVAEAAREAAPALLPPDAVQTLAGLRAVARTTPLVWTVTPRGEVTGDTGPGTRDTR